MPSYRLPLSQDELFDALYLGHGRAVQHLRAYDDAGMEDELRDAFIFDYRYDPDLEASRTPWLRQMLAFVREPTLYRDTVCSELRGLDSPLSWHADQLCELAKQFAADGDVDARDALEGAVDRLGVGWEELIELGGAAALPRVYALWGRFEWWSWTLMDKAFEVVGREAAMAILAVEAQHSEPAAQLLREVQAPDEPRQGSSWPPTLAEILVNIEAGNSNRCIGFGMSASEEDRKELYQRLLREERPDQIQCLLKIFRNRRTPELHDRLFELASSSDDHIRKDARRALGQWQDERVHAFAQTLLNAQPARGMEASVMELFIRNFEDGDAACIEAGLPRTLDDEHAVFGIASDIVEIAESNETPALTGCLLWVYEYSPAACIRSWAVRELMRRGILPEFLRQECSDDSYAGTRALVGGGGDSHG
jgi:hypothetical protein